MMRLLCALACAALGARAFTAKPALTAALRSSPRVSGRTTVRALLDVAAAAAIATAKVDTSALALPSLVTAEAKTITREGLYGDYTVTVDDKFNPADDARSTFKSRAQTKKGKNKYLGIFVVLLVGSFIIPMLQYQWYVQDTPDSLFGKAEPPPPPPPPAKKNFWDRS